MQTRQPDVRGNAGQMRAITHLSGPAMVLAGPGSGKTFVIAERVRYLIEHAGVPPSEILTITFTRAAAAEMKRRFDRLTDRRFPETAFGTFHSVFYELLKRSTPSISEENSLHIVTDNEKHRIMELAVADAHAADPGIPRSEELILAWLAEISRLKGEGADAGSTGENVPHREHFPDAFHTYTRMLKELRRIDFDDMIADTLRLLQEKPAVLDFWRKRFRYIQIDEYQDINRLQFETVKLLAAPANNLFVVGDDDQAIYGFRGSKPELMRGFAASFPGSAQIILNINYRCRRQIIEAAERVISMNTERFVKDQQAGRPEDGEVILKDFAGREEEHGAIIKWLREHPDIPDQTAVIVRTNAQARALAEELVAAGIPVRATVRQKNPYEAREIQEVLAYLRLAGRNPVQTDFFRVMNRPMRYLSRECVRNERFSVSEMRSFYRDRPAMRRTVDRFERELKMLGGLRPQLAIRYLRTQVGFDRFVQSSGEYTDPAAAIARLERLQEEAAAYAYTGEFLKSIAEKSERFSAQSGAGGKGSPQKPANGLHILTMHASKGLEFDTVWLPELNEGTIPSKKIILPEQIAEERRLFYVAMTRARSRLILSYLTGNEHYVYAPSRFLTPLRKDSRICISDGTGI